ncbi:ribosome-binding protein [Tieghemiomyces parasiticus]|uniref:60S ribosomal export protein NMD3 n=1 Tax=Tieghemiomyces parasiticus TaxID=78921 RepID=A0A9W8ABR2_9FUNG|nr:ribosome-binding protein [Tieghemiomyces parasiticus]
MQYVPEPAQQLILCCSCGTAIPPNPANMCENCIRSEVDITEGIPKQATIHFCRNCERYLQPPTQWVACTLESRELLTLCIKKLRGLNKVRLVDAGFIWTEPHSRRVKVKLTIQKEVFTNTILQQVFQVEYTVSYQQCEGCARVMAQNTWKAMVQLRQKVPHKRTFMYLEQLILKHNAHKDTTNIKEARDGLDFYYTNRSHAVKMLDFIRSVVPTRSKDSEQLISTDIHNNTSNYKFTYSVEIAPVCRDDLVCLPPKLAQSFGNINPLCLCSRVSNNLNLIDPSTLTHAEVQNSLYWRTPFTTLLTSRELIEYYVFDVELLGPASGKRYALADVTVARSSDFGSNDTTFHTRTHLGRFLNPGDTVLGYDLSTTNFNDVNFDKLDAGRIPDVILVKKTYPNRRRKNRARHWKLKTLNKEEEELLPRKQEQARIEQDYELFMRDLEEDPEFRATVNLYKAEDGTTAGTKGTSTGMNLDDDEGADVQAANGDDDGEMEEEEEEEEDFPEVKLHELLEELNIQEGDHDDDEEL